jgi:hypothetical protein
MRPSEEQRRGSELKLRITIPYVHAEIVTIVGRKHSRGFAYDPLSLRDPTFWDGDCPRCRAGKFANRGCKLKVRRAIQTLCTARLTSLSTYATRLKSGKTRQPSYSVQVIVGRDARYHLTASLEEDGRWEILVRKSRNQVWSNVQVPPFKSPVLRRTVAMMESARDVSGIEEKWREESLQETTCPHALAAARRS